MLLHAAGSPRVRSGRRRSIPLDIMEIWRSSHGAIADRRLGKRHSCQEAGGGVNAARMFRLPAISASWAAVMGLHGEKAARSPLREIGILKFGCDIVFPPVR